MGDNAAGVRRPACTPGRNCITKDGQERDMSIEQTIRNYILENYLFTDDQSTLQNDESFLNKGIIDSTGILEVISFLESEFAVKVEDREMIPENLDSVNNLVRYVTSKQAAA
jgi:acyl carrier protein